jgi:phosphotriesterase-related protein
MADKPAEDPIISEAEARKQLGIQTVRGLVAPELLGPTMTHEHLLWDQLCWWKGDPEELSLREFVHQPVCMENLGQIYYHAHLHLDNIRQYSVDLAISEAMHLKKAGGSALVDVTSRGLGRDPKALLAICAATGLHVIMGSGYYIAASHPPEMRDWPKEKIADQIVREFAEGVGDTGIRPGVIGEIGVSDLNNPQEVKALQAAAFAQRGTGAPLYIHPPIWETRGLDILDIIEAQGADVTKVVLSHCDPTLDDYEYHDRIAKHGAFIEYDQFGIEFVASEGFFLPRDIDRIRAIRRQIDRGNLAQIIVSQDVSFKTCLVKYGGWGYGHILRDLVPFMKREGFTEKELHTILVENPRRLLAFRGSAVPFQLGASS